VGLLDIDITGPSVARMLNLEGRTVQQDEDGWCPIEMEMATGGGVVKVMSIAFLLGSRDDPIIWRGPKKTTMIKQFLADVKWGHLDYLIIDTPPGTGDEHITIVEALLPCKPDGCVLVTTPQAVAVADVRKEVSFCRKVGLNILGVIENMSGFVCPTCADCTPIFSTGGGERMAADFNIPFLGSLPLEPRLGSCAGNGKLYLSEFPESQCASRLIKIVDGIITHLPAPQK
jgi:Mrp family chromosome partitioning ATPase